MRRILGIGLLIVVVGCGSSTTTITGDLTVTLGAFPASVMATADSAYVRVASDALNVAEVRRLGVTGAMSTTVTVAEGSDYTVDVVVLDNGMPNIAFGGGSVSGVAVAAGGSAITVPIERWSVELLSLADTLVTGSVAPIRVALSHLAMREATDHDPVGINLFVTPAPMEDDYFFGEVTSRFFSTFPADTILWNVTVPASATPTELWFHIRWSTLQGGWGPGYLFDIAVPTIAAGDTLWWRPVIVAMPN